MSAEEYDKSRVYLVVDFSEEWVGAKIHSVWDTREEAKAEKAFLGGYSHLRIASAATLRRHGLDPDVSWNWIQRS